MQINLIRTAWKSYEHEVVPPTAGPAQRQETRRAFYAGAQALLQGMMAMLDPDSEPTEADLAMAAGVDAELRAFNEDVKAGRA